MPSYRRPADLEPGERVGRYIVRTRQDPQTYLADGPDGPVALHFFDLDPNNNELAGMRFEREMTLAVRILRTVTHPTLRSPHAAGLHGALAWFAAAPLTGVPLMEWCNTNKPRWSDLLTELCSLGEAIDLVLANDLMLTLPARHIHIDATSRPSLDLAHLLAARLTTYSSDEDSDDLEGKRLVDLPIDYGYFMAPEEVTLDRPSWRATQFTFCAIVWHALHRSSPFPFTHLLGYASAALEHKVTPPPTDTDVPAWVRRVLARGLLPDPAARWPSMQALLTALQPRGLRRWLRR